RGEIDYEGQAAIELEMAAYEGDYADERESYPYSIVEDSRVWIVKVADLLSAIVEELRRGVPGADISAKFHNTVAQIVNQICQLVASDTGIDQVVLSGGVFQNRLLLRKALDFLEGSGFQVFTHKQVPCNDGGISLGQAAIASFAG
ncbi:MAG: carbamoyltransferase HypF, partial [Dehalococcoidia bacterium]|nr:carbamoyltransferase HypF [Dehalococcoidia bacterium]